MITMVTMVAIIQTRGLVNDDDNDGNDGGSDGVRDGDHVSEIDKMMICRRQIHPSHSRLLGNKISSPFCHSNEAHHVKK